MAFERGRQGGSRGSIQSSPWPQDRCAALLLLRHGLVFKTCLWQSGIRSKVFSHPELYYLIKSIAALIVVVRF